MERKINLYGADVKFKEEKKGVNIERGLITGGGSGGLTELVDMAASHPKLYLK